MSHNQSIVMNLFYSFKVYNKEKISRQKNLSIYILVLQRETESQRGTYSAAGDVIVLVMDA